MRENFCGMCAVVPLALAGLGTSGYSSIGGNVSGDDYRRKKVITIGIGIVFIILSLLIYFWYKDCDQCSPM